MHPDWQNKIPLDKTMRFYFLGINCVYLKL